MVSHSDPMPSPRGGQGRQLEAASSFSTRREAAEAALPASAPPSRAVTSPTPSSSSTSTGTESSTSSSSSDRTRPPRDAGTPPPPPPPPPDDDRPRRVRVWTPLASPPPPATPPPRSKPSGRSARSTGSHQAPSPARSATSVGRSVSRLISQPSPTRLRLEAERAEAEKCPFTPSITRQAHALAEAKVRKLGFVPEVLGRWEVRVYAEETKRREERRRRMLDAANEERISRHAESCAQCTFSPTTNFQDRKARTALAACRSQYEQWDAHREQHKLERKMKEAAPTFAPRTSEIHGRFAKPSSGSNPVSAASRLYQDALLKPQRDHDRAQKQRQTKLERSHTTPSDPARLAKLYQNGKNKQVARRKETPEPSRVPKVNHSEVLRYVDGEEVFDRLHRNTSYPKKKPLKQVGDDAELTFQPRTRGLPPEIARESAEYRRLREEKQKDAPKPRRRVKRRRPREPRRMLHRWEEFDRYLCDTEPLYLTATGPDFPATPVDEPPPPPPERAASPPHHEAWAAGSFSDAATVPLTDPEPYPAPLPRGRPPLPPSPAPRVSPTADHSGGFAGAMAADDDGGTDPENLTDEDLSDSV